MKTVVFVAELGEGLGHVAPLYAIADRLAEEPVPGGVKSVFCVRAPIMGRTVFENRKFTMLPSPMSARVEAISSHSSSYAELLATFGFVRKADLEKTVAAWDDVFDVLAPDLLVADHSPTACLAARGRIPTLVTGNGYTVPPAEMPLFPALKAGMGPPTIQKTLLNTTNAILADRGVGQIDALPQLLAAERRAVFTLPQLDPYGALRRDRLLGSYHAGLLPVPAPAEQHVFVYAGASDAHLEIIVQALAEAGVAISAYLGGIESATSLFLRNRGATVYEKPPALAKILAETSMIVSHGGSGLTQAALMVGRPQVIVPIHAESQITAGRVEDLGAGLAVRKFTREIMKDTLAQVLEIRHFQERASEVARQIQTLRLPADPVGDVVAMCRDLL